MEVAPQLNALKFPMATGTAISAFVIFAVLTLAPYEAYLLSVARLNFFAAYPLLHTLWSGAPLALFTAGLLALKNLRSRRALGRRAVKFAGGEPESLAVAVARIETIAHMLRITSPDIYYDKTCAGTHVDGIGQPWRLILDSGALQALRRRPGRFDAVIAHELAHIASGDALRRALSEALLRGIYAVVIAWIVVTCIGFWSVVMARLGWNFHAPGVAVLLGKYSVRLVCYYIANLIPLGLCILCIRLAYAYLLRRQEFIADWLSACSGFHAATAECLSIQNDAKMPELKRIFSLHPLVQSRILALGIPPLGRMPLFESFIAGLLAAIYTDWVIQFYSPFFKAQRPTFIDMFLPSPVNDYLWPLAISIALTIYVYHNAISIFTPFCAQQWASQHHRFSAWLAILRGALICAGVFYAGYSMQTYFNPRFYIPRLDGHFGVMAPSICILAKYLWSQSYLFVICFAALATAGLATRSAMLRARRGLVFRTAVNGICVLLAAAELASVIACIGLSCCYYFHLGDPLDLIPFLVSTDAPPEVLRYLPFALFGIASLVGLAIVALCFLARRLLLGREDENTAAWQSDPNVAWIAPQHETV